MPDKIDSHIGRLVRRRRQLIGMTQLELARSVGVRFQQIQKYETGVNRLSAARLWTIAHALEVSVSYFYDGLKEITELPISTVRQSEGVPPHRIAGDVTVAQLPRE